MAVKNNNHMAVKTSKKKQLRKEGIISPKRHSWTNGVILIDDGDIVVGQLRNVFLAFSKGQVVQCEHDLGTCLQSNNSSGWCNTTHSTQHTVQVQQYAVQQ